MLRLLCLVLILAGSVASAETPTTRPSATTRPAAELDLSETLVDEEALAKTITNEQREHIYRESVGPSVRLSGQLRGRPIHITGKFPASSFGRLAGVLEPIKAGDFSIVVTFVVSSYAEGARNLHEWSPGDKVMVFGRIGSATFNGSQKPTNAVPNPPLQITLSVGDALIGRIAGPQGFKKDQLEREAEREGKKK